MSQGTAAPAPAATESAPDLMPLNGIDHVEFYVGNAAQSAHYFESAFGFRRVAYSGLETGVRDRTSHVLEQGRIRLVLSGTLGSGTEIARHHALHGDGVRTIALSVPDVDHAHDEAVRRGARSIEVPNVVSDEHGQVRRASIATYGDTLHTFIDRSEYDGPFLPGFEAREEHTPAPDEMLLAIDHIRLTATASNLRSLSVRTTARACCWSSGRTTLPCESMRSSISNV